MDIFAVFRMELPTAVVHICCLSALLKRLYFFGINTRGCGSWSPLQHSIRKCADTLAVNVPCPNPNVGKLCAGHSNGVTQDGVLSKIKIVILKQLHIIRELELLPVTKLNGEVVFDKRYKHLMDML